MKMNRILNLWAHLWGSLFPALEEVLDPLSEKQRQFVAVCEVAQLDRHMRRYAGHWLGRHKQARLAFAKAFLAKALYNLPTTKALIEHLRVDRNLRLLCGWEFASQVPSESTFSRAFAEFASGGLGDVVHEAMVKEHCGEKLVGHVSRDSTSIHAREKAQKKEKKPQVKGKRGRPKKGEKRKAAPPKRLDLQPERSLEENLADLPTACDWGRKKNSQGKVEDWKGYKLHVDVIDGDIPISAIVTSASPHDSQVAIPLAQMSAGRVTSLYDLMDSAYDAETIHEFSRSLGHVPIIDPNRRRGEARELDPASKQRYKERSAAERFNSTLKDNHGGRHVRVRGARKVGLHLMFGVITICATQILRLLQ
jgi:hypothetical protein